MIPAWQREVLRELLGQPVCPFAEQAVAERAERLGRAWGLLCRRDPAGNLLLRWRRGRPAVRWVFAAHMDHPGFLAVRQRGRMVWAEFRGGVRREFFHGSRVAFFPPEATARGRVLSIRPGGERGWLLCRVRLDAPRPVPAGTIGMWDLPAMQVRGRRLLSRACDDVVGSAAVLCALREVRRLRRACDVTALLSRAEEAGFVGALAACQEGSIPRGARVVAIEASAAQPQAPLGGGVVLRVGDRTRTFDPELTAHLCEVARRLAQADRDFAFTRQLMPGGTCEATAYCLAGYSATGLCLPLGNYHNMGRGNRIAAERIDLGDFGSLVKLLAALAADGHAVGSADQAIRGRLAKLLKRRGRYLSEPRTQ